MNHEEVNDFTPEENKAFADVITGSLKQQDIEDLEAAEETAVFEITTFRAHDAIATVIDQMLAHFDYEATVMALQMHIDEINEAFGGDEDD